MKQKRRPTEEIIRILREADSGKSVASVCRAHNIAPASFYRWKKKFGGMEMEGRPQVPGTGKRKWRATAVFTVIERW